MCNGGTGGRLSKLSAELAILVGVLGLLLVPSDQGFRGGVVAESVGVGGFETGYSSLIGNFPLMGNTGNSLFFEFERS